MHFLLCDDVHKLTITIMEQIGGIPLNNFK